jgi:hypothetical protein
MGEAWVLGGGGVAWMTALRLQLFGPVPTAEEALARFTDELRTTQHR